MEIYRKPVRFEHMSLLEDLVYLFFVANPVVIVIKCVSSYLTSRYFHTACLASILLWEEISMHFTWKYKHFHRNYSYNMYLFNLNHHSFGK